MANLRKTFHDYDRFSLPGFISFVFIILVLSGIFPYLFVFSLILFVLEFGWLIYRYRVEGFKRFGLFITRGIAFAWWVVGITKKKKPDSLNKSKLHTDGANATKT